MRLDDGMGTQIDTDSRPLSTIQEIRNLDSKLDGLEKVYKELRREGKHKESQRIRAQLDSLGVQRKHLVKRYEREQKQG